MQNDIERLIEPIKNQIQGNISGWWSRTGTNLSDRLTNVSAAMQTMAEGLDDNNEHELASLIRSGVSALEDLSRRVENAQPEDIGRILEDQGSEHPMGAFLASFAAGFMGARVAKGGTEAYRDSGSDRNQKDLEKIDQEEMGSGSDYIAQNVDTSDFEPQGDSALGFSDPVEGRPSPRR